MLAKPLFFAAAFSIAAPASAALAQDASSSAANAMVACPSQSALEQSISSEGAISPDECTTLEVNTLTSDSGDLCLIDFGTDEGFLGRLRDAAFPTQWWVPCDQLAAAIRP